MYSLAAPGVFPCMPWNTQDCAYKHKYIYMYMLVYLLHIAICKSGFADWPSPTESSDRAAHQTVASFSWPLLSSHASYLSAFCNSGGNDWQARRPALRQPATARQPRFGCSLLRPACYLRQGEHTSRAVSSVRSILQSTNLRFRFLQSFICCLLSREVG
jgi:hypothetical protein